MSVDRRTRLDGQGRAVVHGRAALQLEAELSETVKNIQLCSREVFQQHPLQPFLLVFGSRLVIIIR